MFRANLLMTRIFYLVCIFGFFFSMENVISNLGIFEAFVGTYLFRLKMNDGCQNLFLIKVRVLCLSPSPSCSCADFVTKWGVSHLFI